MGTKITHELNQSVTVEEFGEEVVRRDFETQGISVNDD